MNAPRALALGLAAGWLLAGCAVVPLPKAVALQERTAKDQEWDTWDCIREMAHRTGYNPTDSPMANIFRRVFVFGTAGAAVGGLVTGIPASAEGPASDGLIAGAAVGGGAGLISGWSGQERFERAWAVCMESRGYRVEPREPADN